MIHFNCIAKSYKNDFWAKPFWALRDVSFQIPEGPIIGLLGANGAGKTTLMKILMGFITPSSGKVILDPHFASNKKEFLQRVGFLPERPYFYPYLTGFEFIFYLAKLHHLSGPAIKKELSYWAERLKIEHALNRKIKSYSKGMLQRLGLISTLIHNPDFIILDEPLSGLDPVGRKELKEVIREANQKGKTIFFSSHIVPDVEELCQQVVILNQSKLIYEGTISHLLDSSAPSDIFFIDYCGPLLPSHWKATLLFHDEGQKFCQYQIHGSMKNEIIQWLIKENCPIEKLEKQRASLEEIIFHWKE